MRKRLSFVVLLVLCIGSLVPGQTSEAIVRSVERVIDGDTIVVSSVGTVRLIGIDTPETVDPRKPVQAFGKEATAAMTKLALGQTVRLEFEGARTDRYNRTLAYAYLSDGRMVNAEMIRQGFAHAYTTYPFSRAEQFLALERTARAAGVGLWSGATTEGVQAVQPEATILPDPADVVVDLGPRATGLYHRDTCPWLNGVVGARTFTIADAKKRYFQPHCACVHGEEAGPPCPHVPRSTQAPSAPVPATSTPTPTPAAPARVAPAAPKPAAPVARMRCQATTQKGTQCLRMAQPGRSFCWQH